MAARPRDEGGRAKKGEGAAIGIGEGGKELGEERCQAGDGAADGEEVQHMLLDEGSHGGEEREADGEAAEGVERPRKASRQATGLPPATREAGTQVRDREGPSVICGSK